MSEIEFTTTTAQNAVTIRERVKMSDIPQAMGRIYGELCTLMAEVQFTGPPFVYYHSWSE